MTLLEVVLALSIYGVVIAGALGFVAAQNSAFHRGLDRMTVLRNARYVVESLTNDVPTAGTNVPQNQPVFVYGDEDVMAFSADYASNVLNDVFSVYVDPDAPPGQVTAPGSPFTIPMSSFAWPDSSYQSGAGTASPAELIIFYLDQDSATSRTDDYALFRQVNDGAPEVVSGHLLPVEGVPFFRFFEEVDSSGAPSIIDSIPAADLPVRHLDAYHGGPTETEVSLSADRVRAVRVSFQASNGLEGEAERVVSVSRLIAMPNAGMRMQQTCGSEPMLESAVSVANAVDAGGDPVAALSWDPATDESSGERDVVRYVIYRQTTPIGTDWGDPFLSVPAGENAYQFQDGRVESGAEYAYALAAQDCTPSLSDLAVSSTITIP